LRRLTEAIRSSRTQDVEILLYPIAANHSATIYKCNACFGLS
jgi:hypothetical protein